MGGGFTLCRITVITSNFYYCFTVLSVDIKRRCGNMTTQYKNLTELLQLIPEEKKPIAKKLITELNL